MENFIDSLGLIFILTEIITLLISFSYSIRQYKHVMIAYKEKQSKVPKIYISKNENYKKTVIKSNMTEQINTKEIKNKMFTPVLCFYFDNKKTKSIKLNGNRENIFIGRSKSDDIVINEPTVSRGQCCITRNNGKFFITTDINKNPVYLNNKLLKTKEEILQNNDIISMAGGKIYFKFYSSEKEILNSLNKDTN